jgi:AcrR family transcriptional regulator
MAGSKPENAGGARRRRSDADRSVAAILDAALDVLAGDPDASMAEIARKAGLVRATIYAHFPAREALVTAVTERAIGEVTDAIAATDPASGDPVEALRRVLAVAWGGLARFASLAAINAQLPPEEFHRLHRPLLQLLFPLIERGQQSGAFRDDVPTAWHLSTVLALVHAASAEVRAGRVAEADVEAAVVATVLGAVGAAGR